MVLCVMFFFLDELNEAAASGQSFAEEIVECIFLSLDVCIWIKIYKYAPLDEDGLVLKRTRQNPISSFCVICWRKRAQTS